MMTYGNRDPTVQHVHFVEKTGAHRLTMQASKRNTDSSLNAPVLCRFGEWFIGAFFFFITSLHITVCYCNKCPHLHSVDCIYNPKVHVYHNETNASHDRFYDKL